MIVKKQQSPPIAVNSFSKSSETDWKEIQETFTKYCGEYVGVNKKITTAK